MERSGVIVEVGLFLGLHLIDSFDIVFVVQAGASSSQGAHSGFHTDCFELCSVEIFGGPCEFYEVDFVVVHLSRVDFEDLDSGVFGGEGELYLTIQSAGSHQCGVQDIGSVGGAKHFDIVVGRKTVQVVQELEHGSLHLSVS